MNRVAVLLQRDSGTIKAVLVVWTEATGMVGPEVLGVLVATVVVGVGS